MIYRNLHIYIVTYLLDKKPYRGCTQMTKRQKKLIAQLNAYIEELDFMEIRRPILEACIHDTVKKLFGRYTDYLDIPDFMTKYSQYLLVKGQDAPK